MFKIKSLEELHILQMCRDSRMEITDYNIPIFKALEERGFCFMVHKEVHQDRDILFATISQKNSYAFWNAMDAIREAEYIFELQRRSISL